MNNKTANTCPSGEDNNHHRLPGDQVNYKSEDGLVEVHTKVEGAWRWPQHGYPIVCLRLRPRSGTRIQVLPDGSGGLDVLLRHSEVAAHLFALNAADPKSAYKVSPVPQKPRDRKQHWDQINRRRWGKKQQR